MKKIRFLIFPIILAVAVLFTGELYQSYLSDFAEGFFWKTDMQLVYEKNPEKMYRDVMQSAQDNQIDFFVQTKDYPTTSRTEIDLYCSSKAFANQLQKRYRIHSGRARSLFFGETMVRFHLYRDYPMTNDSQEFFLTGNDEDVLRFKQVLVDEYYGSMPKKPITILRGMNQNIVALWSVVVILFLLLTQYEWVTKKKEYAFLRTQGEPASRLYFRNVLPDSLCLLLETGITCLLFSRMTGFPLYLRSVQWALPFLLVSEWLIFFQIMKLDFKTVFRRDFQSRGILIWSYGLQAIATVLAIVAVSMNCSVIAQAVRFHQQKEEINRFGDLNMYALNYYVPETDSYERISSAEKALANVQRKIWDSTYSDGFPLALYHIGMVENKEVLVCSSGAKDYLNSKLIKEDLSSLPKNRIIYFLPEGMAEWPDIETDRQLFPLAHLAYGLKDDGTHDYSVIRYQDDVKLLGFGNDYGGTALLRSPIILLANYDSFFPGAEILEDPNESDGTVIPYYLYNESPAKIEKKMMAENYGDYRVVVNTTNVSDNYYHYWGLLKHSLIIGTVLSAVLLFLVLCLNVLIIRFELVLNGMDFALKRIFGYQLVERYRHLYLQITISSLAGLMAAFVLNETVFHVNMPFLLAGGLLMVLMIYGSLIWSIHRQEKEDLVRILKRGGI